MNILVVGYTTEKGAKVSDFLHSRGVSVYGLDRRTEGTYSSLTRRFSLNPRHKESLRLMFEISKPSALVYCVSNHDGTRENYLPFLTLVLEGVEVGIAKIALVVNENLPIKPVTTTSQIEILAMILALQVLSKEKKYEYLVINEKDNLLKEIKKFLLKEEQEGEVL